MLAVGLSCVCAKLFQLCLTLWCYGLEPASLLCPWDFPRKNTGVDIHAPSRDLPNLEIEPESLMSAVLADRFFITSATFMAFILLG